MRCLFDGWFSATASEIIAVILTVAIEILLVLLLLLIVKPGENEDDDENEDEWQDCHRPVCPPNWRFDNEQTVLHHHRD
jgi:hypothetical protein